MIILIGPSASGKTEIAKYLISNYAFKKFITTTTRSPRIGEINNVDYHFISLDEFNRKIHNHEFIEYVNYNSNYYGTTFEEIDNNKVLILEPKGLDAFLNSNTKSFISFYIDAPLKTREERMILRHDNPIDIKNRIEKDDLYFQDSKSKVNFVIKNDNDTTIADAANEIYKLYKEKMMKN